MKGKDRAATIHAKLQEGYSAVLDLCGELDRLERENLELRVLVAIPEDQQTILRAALTWYADPANESAWSRPSTTDCQLRAAIRRIVDKIAEEAKAPPSL